jgi:hypothetical protein
MSAEQGPAEQDKTIQDEVRPVVVVKGGSVYTTDATPKDKRQEPERKLDLSTVLSNPSADYDGDAEFIGLAEPKYTPFDPFEAVKIGPGDKAYDNWEVQASLFEVSKDGKSYRINKLSNKASFQARVRESADAWEVLERTNSLIEIAPPHELRESTTLSRNAAIDAEAQRLLREDGFGTDFQFGGGGGEGFGSDSEGWSRAGYGSGVDVNAEYIPLLGGPTSKALYQYQYLDMHRKAFEAYNHNPVAHQLVELQTSFVLGRGVDHTCTNEDVEEVWQEFVERTNFYTDLENIANDLWWQGEMMMEFYDNTPKKGFVDYRLIDPSTVWDIITDVEDIQKIYYYHQQYSTVYQQYTRGNIETMKYIIRQIPAEDVLHIKLNVSKYEKRGRTDLFSILGWLKRLKDLMNSRVIKGQLEAAFVWDVTVNSGDADVSQATLNLPDPYKAGSTFVHNKNLTLAAVGGTIKGGGGESGNPDIHALINMIAVGFGIPAQFIGEVSKGAKAGALSATEPGTKRFERRQRLIENICHSVANRVIALAITAGRLDIDSALPDARSITKLGAQSDQYVNRDDVKGELETKQEEANEKAEQVNDQNNQMAVHAHKVGMKMQVQDQTHRHSMDQQMLKQQHQHNMATAKNTNVQRHEFLTGSVPTPGAGTPMEQAGAQQGAPAAQGQPQQAREAALKPQPKADTKDENTTNTPKKPGLNKAQKRRKQTIKDRGNFAKEFLEFIFPAIAQEDRSAKLKDLALAEAMQWLPKSWAAKLAAKELNITTYSWEDAWREIQEEAKLGLSIAHVYTQDNQHVPDTTIAQDVQAELAAKQPVPAAQQQVNVPVPPPVAGDKLMPAQPPGGAPKPGAAPGQPKGTGAQSNPSAAPGKQPNSGSTKTNKFAGQDPVHTDPTAKSHGYSAAANSPMTSEGIGNIKRQAMKQSLRHEIRDSFLREALGPALHGVRDIARFILSTNQDIEELLGKVKDD